MLALPMTSTDKPKLDLSHIKQAASPVSVPPSEKDQNSNPTPNIIRQIQAKPKQKNASVPSSEKDRNSNPTPNIIRQIQAKPKQKPPSSKEPHDENHSISMSNKYAKGVVDGIEADNRVFRSELEPYREALRAIHNKGNIASLPHKNNIHAGRKVRSAVRDLVPSGRLGPWR